ncbi:hypothetical protein Tco_0107599, partial [Tanacetum coccineum]
PGKGTVSENKLMCCVPDTAYGPHLIRRIPGKSALAVEIDLTWSRSSLIFIAASVEARISLIMFEFSSCLLADSAINLVSDSSRFGLRSGYEEFLLFHCWAWIAASPSEVSVLLVLEDVPLCHFWEYSSISWMAILASAAVLEGMAPLESRICRVGTSSPL